MTAPAPSPTQLAGLTYGTVEPEPAALGRRRDIWLSVVLALAVGAVWLFF